MSLPQFLGLLVLVVGTPLNLYVTLRLWRLSREAPTLKVLRDRAIVSTVVLFVVAVFGLIFFNNDLVPPPLSFNDTKIATRTVMLVLAVVPAVYWLWIYRGEE